MLWRRSSVRKGGKDRPLSLRHFARMDDRADAPLDLGRRQGGVNSPRIGASGPPVRRPFVPTVAGNGRKLKFAEPEGDRPRDRGSVWGCAYLNDGEHAPWRRSSAVA